MGCREGCEEGSLVGADTMVYTCEPAIAPAVPSVSLKTSREYSVTPVEVSRVQLLPAFVER